jgi:hypothetical protein
MIWIATDKSSSAAFSEKAESVPVKVPATEGEVRVLSEVEVFQGFVRLKVGIKNEMNTVITDAKLDLEYDDNAMRLDRIEPNFEQRGNKVIFGVIHPGEEDRCILS